MKWLIPCVVGLCSLSVQGQHTFFGKILDSESKLVLPMASVSIVELNTSTISDERGEFRFNGLPSGKFILQTTHVGYRNSLSVVSLPIDSGLAVYLSPAAINMSEVVVTGTMLNTSDETIYNVSQLSAADLRQNGSVSVSDALSRIPGVSQLTTGVGISKPVIRGLYGNRIQVNVNGIRFDNQQWQDEHGLGLSDIGIDRVEVIRGPASVLYGSDAMGGVVNVIDEKPAAMNSVETDRLVKLFSNSYGLTFNYGRKKSTENRWKKFRIGFDNHADYSDGNNSRILNSRFASYNVKASWGKQKERSTHVVNVAASTGFFGFVFDSLSRKEKDGRLSRSFDGPHHSVSFVQADTENSYFRNGRKIKLNGGLISNLRLEDEGGGGISLSMLLNTLNLLSQVTQPIGAALDMTYGGSLMFQTNTNFGGRIIIPDAWTGEASAFSFVHADKGNLILEGGLRYDRKLIQTFATRSLNITGNESPTQSILPFSKSYNAFNISVGSTLHLSELFLWKLNASTGYRPGNLAELSSNGLHEGSLRWEIGLPNAKVEQNLNTETSIHFHSKAVKASLSAYRNAFRNFFYLAPTGSEYFGFFIYEFRQSNATLEGGEFELDVAPKSSPFEIISSFSIISAKKSDGSYLPFIPANRLKNEVRFKIGTVTSFKDLTARLGSTYVFDQNHPAEFETGTSDYLLLDLGVTAQVKQIRYSLTCTNLLNKKYYDHLSRFKYYGIANMGRNIVLTLNF